MKTVLSIMAAAALCAAQAPEARTVRYGVRDIIPIYGKLRHSTIIVLPPEEVVLEAVVGDKSAWDAVGRPDTNIISVKPKEAKATSNLNVYTATNNVYSFTLQEGTAQTDLKVFVEAKEDLAVNSPVKFFTAAQVRGFEDRAVAAEQKAALIAEQSQKEVQKAAAASQLTAQRAESEALKNIQFPYVFEKDKAPFNVHEIYHNGKFTYINASPWKTFVVYEKADDGKPEIVEFLPDGPNRYVAYQVIHRGVIAINKEKMEFSAQR